MSRTPMLTREQAIAIRELYASNSAGMAAIAARCGISRALVSRIVKGQHSLVADLPDIARPVGRSIVSGEWTVGGEWVEA